MIEARPDFDVAIVGGGPAGSSMGAYLARAGARCVILEKESFPRPRSAPRATSGTTGWATSPPTPSWTARRAELQRIPTAPLTSARIFAES